MTKNKPRIAFFGTPQIAVTVLDVLVEADLVPNLIVTNPDKPVGRKQVLTPPPVALWAKERGVELLQPESLRDSGSPAPFAPLREQEWDLFVVVAYGKILPKWLLEIPKHGTLNVHPSLLPTLRGASPVRSAILNDMKGELGVTIMLVDEELDHGPIIAQELIDIDEKTWPLDGQELDGLLAQTGGALLAETIPEWIVGNIDPQEQDHEHATFSTKITKDMSELHINPHALPTGKGAYQMLLKIKAFSGWPETFFIHDGKRVKIKDATLSENGQLQVLKVVPEGKKEMSFAAYVASL